MAENIGELVVKLGMDSSLFERSTKELNQRMKALKSEFQYTTEQAKLYGDTTDILQEKATVLHKAIDAQKAKLEKLRGEYDKSKEQTGENSVQTQKLAEQVNIAAGELTSYERQLKETRNALDGQAEDSPSTAVAASVKPQTAALVAVFVKSTAFEVSTPADMA